MMDALKDIKVGVIYGGDSPEREVSLASGSAVVEAFEKLGVDVEPLLVSSALDALSKVQASQSDVFFIALHGGWGEDGRLQGALDLLGKKYTGSGHRSCALAMDKKVSKAIFERCGIPTAPYISINAADLCSGFEEELKRLLALWGTMVVKPSGCGSTVGVNIVQDVESAFSAVRDAFTYDKDVLIEKYIPGREITVTIWEDKEEVMAFPVIEIIPEKGFYDYRAKYTPGVTRYKCPAHLPKEIGARIKEVAVGAHRALGCRVYSRVDIRLSQEGTPYVLEVNTAPGMTSTSLVPKAALAFGWSFPELVSKIVIKSLGK